MLDICRSKGKEHCYRGKLQRLSTRVKFIEKIILAGNSTALNVSRQKMGKKTESFGGKCFALLKGTCKWVKKSKSFGRKKAGLLDEVA